MCQLKSVSNGLEYSAGLFSEKAISSNSGTILPTPNGGSLPLTAVDRSSENLSANSAKSSPFLSLVYISLIFP